MPQEVKKPGLIVTCPNCAEETFAQSSQSCPNCGASFLRRPRAELVPPLPPEGVRPVLGPFVFDSMGSDNPSDTVEQPIETQWTKLEKVSLGRALFSRISGRFGRSRILRSSDQSAVVRKSHEPISPQNSPRDDHPVDGRILVVNLAQAVKRDCAACGGRFASSIAGERLLLAKVTATACYLLCANCGDHVMSQLKSEEAAKRYEWDWAIPLRGEEERNRD
jgi:hypothetical protein